MRDYEMMIIIDPTVDERNITTFVDKLLQVVPNEGGTLEKVDIWGKRRCRRAAWDMCRTA